MTVEVEVDVVAGGAPPKPLKRPLLVAGAVVVDAVAGAVLLAPPRPISPPAGGAAVVEGLLNRPEEVVAGAEVLGVLKRLDDVVGAVVEGWLLGVVPRGANKGAFAGCESGLLLLGVGALSPLNIPLEAVPPPNRFPPAGACAGFEVEG